MTTRHPHEYPFYNGPELQGLSSDEKFDLAKQLRIAARNRRLSAKLQEPKPFPWMVLAVLSLAMIAAGLGMSLQLVGLLLK